MIQDGVFELGNQIHPLEEGDPVECPAKKAPAENGMAHFVLCDSFEDAAHLGNGRALCAFRHFDRRERFSDASLVNRRSRHTHEAWRRKHFAERQRPRTERHTGVAARESEAQARVLDLVTERGLCSFH